MSPLRTHREWIKNICNILKNKKDNQIKINFDQVDTHNIVPVWETSKKQEYVIRSSPYAILEQSSHFAT